MLSLLPPRGRDFAPQLMLRALAAIEQSEIGVKAIKFREKRFDTINFKYAAIHQLGQLLLTACVIQNVILVFLQHLFYQKVQ